MKSSKSYYKDLGLIRVLLCIAVLLYHMNILKGGYLAVCSFFALSGYLTCISCFKKEKFSFKKYYLNKLLHIYLPLVVVVFISLVAISFVPDINWFNLKPETTSVLLGYNNFWQLSANLDYFARHVNSPFMHLWYMAIILQFDLIFPFIFVFLRKIGDKVHKVIPCIFTTLLAVIFGIYFYKSSLSQNIMVTYYNTFTRIFSLIFGVALGFFHAYYSLLVPRVFKNKIFSRVIFYLYLLILIILFIFIDSQSPYFAITMIITTLITCRLIDYGTLFVKTELSFVDKLIKYFSNLSYEIYLVQYPVIFLFQFIPVIDCLKIPLIIILTFVISCLLNFGMNFRLTNRKTKVIRNCLFIVVLGISLYGAYQYFVAEDHTQEMKELELKLAENERIMQERQKEYAASLKEKQENWMSTLKDLENYENELLNVVANLPIVGVGDSVMLGALDNLQVKFPNGYFDAKISRTAWVANDILKNLSYRGILGDPIVINLGANGDCPTSCKNEIMKTIGNRKVFWLNTTNDVNINNSLVEFSLNYSNLYIIDWNSASKEHPEYFIADGIHLTLNGKEAYTKTIYDSIYNVYLEEYRQKKDEIIKSYEESLRDKVSFFGNGILINAYDYLQENFSESELIINNEFNYETLKMEIENRVNNNTLTNKLVFAFDKNLILTKEEYKELVELCKGSKIYIVVIEETPIDLDHDNVMFINFYEEIKLNSNYLMADKIHLTKEGNEALIQMLKNSILNDENI